MLGCIYSGAYLKISVIQGKITLGIQDTTHRKQEIISEVDVLQALFLQLSVTA